VDGVRQLLPLRRRRPARLARLAVIGRFPSRLRKHASRRSSVQYECQENENIAWPCHEDALRVSRTDELPGQGAGMGVARRSLPSTGSRNAPLSVLLPIGFDEHRIRPEWRPPRRRGSCAPRFARAIEGTGDESARCCGA
jgi:hypothetical protein